MKAFANVVILFGLALGVSQAVETGGIIDGVLLNSLDNFPHAVSILVNHQLEIGSEIRNWTGYCGGSILNNRWILTSQSCVSNAVEVEVIFNRTNLDSVDHSFSITTDHRGVFRFPGYPNLALIKLPVILEFSRTIKPIELLRDNDVLLGNQFAAMAGIHADGKHLSYGRFRITSTDECKRVYGSLYDEHTEICTLGWKNNTNVPCDNNVGGGLLIDWPSNPKLAGVFSAPTNCLSYIPAIYVKMPEFIDWIEQVMSNN